MQMEGNKSRIVITGMDLVSALGDNLSETITNLSLGQSKYAQIPSDRFSTSHKSYRNRQAFLSSDEEYFKAMDSGDYVLDYYLKKSISRALDHSQLKAYDYRNSKIGMCIGTSVGASYASIKYSNKLALKDDLAYELGLKNTPRMIGEVAKYFDLNGPVSTISTACSSGTNSIGRAYDFILMDKADQMICGGIDFFTELTYSGFNALGAISKTKCRPLSHDRDGMSMGDGAAILILEKEKNARNRKARILAEIKGYATLNEGYHPTSPHPEGKYALKCMSQAIKNSGLTLNAIQYVNLHGTATLKNDISEIRACDKLFESKSGPTYVNSTKSLTGHTLGASGSVEAIISTLSIKNQEIYCGGYPENTLPASALHIVNKKNFPISIDNVLSNSFGFGGNMSSLIISKYLP